MIVTLTDNDLTAKTTPVTFFAQSILGIAFR
jgi:hypothetical protein